MLLVCCLVENVFAVCCKATGFVSAATPTLLSVESATAAKHPGREGGAAVLEATVAVDVVVVVTTAVMGAETRFVRHTPIPRMCQFLFHLLQLTFVRHYCTCI